MFRTDFIGMQKWRCVEYMKEFIKHMVEIKGGCHMLHITNIEVFTQTMITLID